MLEELETTRTLVKKVPILKWICCQVIWLWQEKRTTVGPLFLSLLQLLTFTHRHNYQEWSYFYKIIFFANTVIDALAPDGQEPEGAEARAFMGQALAARAYGYLYLSQLFVNDPSNVNQDVLPMYVIHVHLTLENLL